MENIKIIDDIILSSLKFIKAEQQANGNFLSLSSIQPDDFTNSSSHGTTFITSHILCCLNHFCVDPKIHNISGKAAKFLLSQKNDYWSFNYWLRDSIETEQIPYPDDLDDTFSALSGIWLYDQKLIGGKALQAITRLLINTESKPGGPYRTWLVQNTASQSWLDIDIAVNANVGYFLFLQQVHLSGLDNFFDHIILNKNLVSPYYPNIYPIIYFLSRFYKGDCQNYLIKLLLSKRRKDFSWNNPLNTALSLSALLNLGYDGTSLNHSVNYLIKSHQANHWPPFAFCLDPAKKGKKYYAGSAALSTAFCILSLDKYKKHCLSKKVGTGQDKKTSSILTTITSVLEKRFADLGDDFKDPALHALEIIKNNPQIPLLPFQFYTCLDSSGKEISPQTIATLGNINSYGWIAYTIYDNFLDGTGDRQALSLANVCLREVANGYKSLFDKGSKNDECIQKILDGIDKANAWETRHCQININNKSFAVPRPLPDFKDLNQLAHKSLGYALGPISILLLKGLTPDSDEIKNITEYFIHYIIARQLNDDAHDWTEDLKNSRLNYVNSLVLRRAALSKISLIKDERHLKNIFWSDIISPVCNKIFYHTNQARKKIQKINIIEDPTVLYKLLEPSELAAKQAIIESKKAQEFLANF